MRKRTNLQFKIVAVEEEEGKWLGYCVEVENLNSREHSQARAIKSVKTQIAEYVTKAYQRGEELPVIRSRVARYQINHQGLVADYIR